MDSSNSLADQIRDWFERSPKAQRAYQRLSADLDAVAKWVDSATSGLRERVTPIIDPARASAVQDKASEMASAVQDKASEMASAVQNKASEMASAVQNKAGETASAVQDKADETASAVQDKAGETASAVQDKAGETASKVEPRAPNRQTDQPAP